MFGVCQCDARVNKICPRPSRAAAHYRVVVNHPRMLVWTQTVMMIAFADDNCGSGSLNAEFQVCQNILLEFPLVVSPFHFMKPLKPPHALLIIFCCRRTPGGRRRSVAPGGGQRTARRCRCTAPARRCRGAVADRTGGQLT